MARHPRFVLQGQPQHVIQRGNNRDIIFVADEDYQYYLQKLDDGCKKNGIKGIKGRIKGNKGDATSLSKH